MSTDEDQQMAALVAADRPAGSAPDLVALRAGGRRLVRRRRLAAGAAAAAVALAVGVPLAVVGGDESTAPDQTQVATTTPSEPPTTRTTTEPAVEGDPLPAEVRVPLPGGQFQELLPEDGEIRGDEVVVGDFSGYEQVLYAAQRTFPGETAPATYVAVGIRYEGRLLRVVSALAPMDVPEPDGVDLWGGYREDDGSYLLVGSAPGDVEVEAARDAESVPVTGRSTTVLPDYTVFYDTGAFQDSWDPLQAAPLTLLVDGEPLEVRGRTYVS